MHGPRAPPRDRRRREGRRGRRRACLWSAHRRLWYATADGEEITEEAFRNEDAHDRFTPSWVSPVWRSELGPALVVDVGPCAPEPMADLMRRIVREELERAGVTSAEVTGYPEGWEPSEQVWVIDGFGEHDIARELP